VDEDRFTIHGQSSTVTKGTTMKEIEGIPVWGDPVDESAFSQIKNCAKTADAAALMADHHKGYAVPIGGVLAYYEHISPSGVGFDIACGNKAVLIDIPAAEIRKNIRKIMDDIWHNLAFGIGQKNNICVDHPLFDDPAWKLRAVAPHKKMAQEQLGTIGSGNHYVDLLEDEQGRTWIGVHFGSRGLGHRTATYFLEAGGAKDGMNVDPLILSALYGTVRALRLRRAQLGLQRSGAAAQSQHPGGSPQSSQLLYSGRCDYSHTRRPKKNAGT
jgi:tRNA-splicing ligase RtcB